MTGDMKVVVASHSLVAERQFWFWNYVDMQPGVQILKIAPRDWAGHHVDWGYDIVKPSFAKPWQYASNLDIPDMTTFVFSDQALAVIEDFKPDIIYVQNEAYCRVTAQLHRIAGRMGCKFALFAWENLRPYDQMHEEVRHVLSNADLVICGSRAAENLVKPYNSKTARIIQVGVDTASFYPQVNAKDYDLIFQGRMVPEKGIEILKAAAEGKSWKILWPDPQRKDSYSTLYHRYSMAKVHVGHSLDTEFWREQHGSYSNYEALACGLRVATSHSQEIVESLQGCPGVMFDQQGYYKEMQRTIEILLQQEGPNMEGRKWIEQNYGYAAITEKHIQAFDRVLSK